MFTGIIEEVGEIKEILKLKDGVQITINSQKVRNLLSIGDSVALDGACQTVTQMDSDSFTVQAVGETIQKTTLGKYSPGQKINLESPLTLNKPLGGHLMQGHVSGTSKILQWRKRGENYFLEIEIAEDLERYFIPEGSIGVDGISLTIARIQQNRIGISIIPYTVKNTTLSLKKTGDTVNIEIDVIARYVESLLPKNPSGNLTLNKLKQWGY